MRITENWGKSVMEDIARVAAANAETRPAMIGGGIGCDLVMLAQAKWMAWDIGPIGVPWADQLRAWRTAQDAVSVAIQYTAMRQCRLAEAEGVEVNADIYTVPVDVVVWRVAYGWAHQAQDAEKNGQGRAARQAWSQVAAHLFKVRSELREWYSWSTGDSDRG